MTTDRVLFVLVSNVQKDRLMHATDLFTPSRTMVESLTPWEIKVVCEASQPVRDYIAAAKKALEESKEYRVVALWCPYIAEGAYYDETIQTVSNGYQWAMFKDLLEHFHFLYEKPAPTVDPAVCPSA